MRTAGLSSFRKLYGKSETTLTTGTWQIAIKSSNINSKFFTLSKNKN